MMRYAKSTLCVALVLASLQLFVFSVGGVQARQVGTKPISWYTKRNAEHKAPVLDGDLRVIRKHKALYCDEKAAEQDFFEYRKETWEFDRLVAELPPRAWIE